MRSKPAGRSARPAIAHAAAHAFSGAARRATQRPVILPGRLGCFATHLRRQLRQHLLVLLVVLGALAHRRVARRLGAPERRRARHLHGEARRRQPRACHLHRTTSSGGGHTFLCWRACAQQRSWARQKRPMYCAASCLRSSGSARTLSTAFVGDMTYDDRRGIMSGPRPCQPRRGRRTGCARVVYFGLRPRPRLFSSSETNIVEESRNRGCQLLLFKRVFFLPPPPSSQIRRLPVTYTQLDTRHGLPWTPSAASSKRSSSCAAFATSPCRTPLPPSWPGLSSSRMLRRSVVGSPPLLPCSTHHLAWPRTVPTRQGAQRERRARPHQDGYRTPAHERLALT